jgi:hypothetical protein
MRSPDPNRSANGVRIGDPKRSPTNVQYERTEISDADVSLETAVDAGARTSNSHHQYGPHDPTTAPTTVVVGQLRKWRGRAEVEVPIAPAVLEQRRRINELAAARIVADLRERTAPQLAAGSEDA